MMIKYALIFAILFLSIAVSSAVLAGKGGIPNQRAQPHVPQNLGPDATCTSEYTAARLISANIEATVERGGEALGSATYLNDTEGEQYVITAVQYLNDQVEMELPAEWVVFMPAAFCVEASGNQFVEITISIPNNAKRGEYFAFLVFAVSPEGGGISVGVAIKATITVE